jgi:hypothetical protein
VLIVKGKKVKGRTVSSRVTFQKLRETPEDYPDPIDFALVRDVVDGTLSIQTTAADSADEDARQTTPPPRFGPPLSEQIAAHLRERGPATRSSLRVHFRLSEDRLRRALCVLEEQRTVTNGSALIQGRKRQVVQLVEAGLYAAE